MKSLFTLGIATMCVLTLGCSNDENESSTAGGMAVGGMAAGGNGSTSSRGGSAGDVTCVEDPMGAAGIATVSDDFVFEEAFAGNPNVTMATAWGDRSAGPHGTMGTFAAGFDSGPHTHSAAYYGVVLTGTIVNPFGTERAAPELGPGSMWFVPAGEQHATRCVSPEPCTFYFHGEAAFDFVPIMVATDPPSRDAIALPADDVTFQQAAPFVEFGAGWGDMTMGAHGTFGRFPPMASSPPHIHSDDYYGIVISGSLSNPFNEDANAPVLSTGGFWSVPGDTNHVTACVGDAPCLFYFHARSEFDFSPVCE